MADHDLGMGGYVSFGVDEQMTTLGIREESEQCVLLNYCGSWTLEHETTEDEFHESSNPKPKATVQPNEYIYQVFRSNEINKANWNQTHLGHHGCSTRIRPKTSTDMSLFLLRRHDILQQHLLFADSYRPLDHRIAYLEITDKLSVLGSSSADGSDIRRRHKTIRVDRDPVQRVLARVRTRVR